MKRSKLLILIILIQSSLIFIAFKPFLFHPTRYIFCDAFDGLKNYHTLNSYIQDTSNHHIFFYRMMNYPFGDIVMYTDNTPLVSIPLKMAASHFELVRENGIAIFDLILIFNFLLASILTFNILKRFILNPMVLLIFSISIVWLNSMVPRLGEGHFNLSLSSIILANIYLLIKAYEERDSLSVSFLMALLLVAFTSLTFFIHGYYLFICSFFIGYFFLFTAIIERRPMELIKAIFIPLLSIGIILLLTHFIDFNLPFRNPKVIGYGIDEWEMSLGALFYPYVNNTFRFFLPAQSYPFHYETKAYLGSAFVVGLSAFAIYQCNKRKFIYRVKEIYTKNKKAPLLTILMFSGFFMLIMSFGEDGYMFHTRHHVYNFVNPMYYLRRIIPELTNLRCAARFHFPFYFIAFIFFAVFFERYLILQMNLFTKLFTVLLIFLFALDTYDAVSSFPAVDNILAKDSFRDLQFPGINGEHFQAILPIPFFHIGSEDLDYSMQTDEGFFSRSVRLSTLTNLPLMNSKMSRTPDYQNRALVNIFLNDSLDNALHKQLAGKTILVMLDKQTSSPDCPDCEKPSREPALTAFNKGRNFPKRMNMRLLHEEPRYVYYSWKIEP